MTTLYGYVSNQGAPEYDDIVNSDLPTEEKVKQIQMRGQEYRDALDRDAWKNYARMGLGTLISGASALPIFNIPYVGTGLGGAMYDAGQAIVEGDKLGDIAKRAGRGFAIGETVGAVPYVGKLAGKTKAGQAVGEGATQLANKLAENPTVLRGARQLQNFLATDVDNLYNPFKTKSQVLYDQIPESEFRNWFGNSAAVESNGLPKLFSDGSNVYITDGYSNNGISKFSYKGSHRAPSFSEGPVMERIENTGDVNLAEVAQGYHNQPKDYFTAMGPRWYGYDDEAGLESLNAIRRIMRGDNDVTIYRAVPNDINSNTINNGDWITLSRKYAQTHGEGPLEGNYKILEQRVPTKEVWWDGNDIREWGYDNGLPQSPDIMLSIQNPYRQANLPTDWREARKIRDMGYDGIITDDGNYLVFEKDQIKRTSDVENFDNINLSDKLYKMSEDMKNGELNPLKYKGKSVTIKNITNKEQEYVFHEIDTHISDAEKLKGRAIRRLPNPDDGKDYIYRVKYDQTGNGKHKITRKYEVTEEKYD